MFDSSVTGFCRWQTGYSRGDGGANFFGCVSLLPPQLDRCFTAKAQVNGTFPFGVIFALYYVGR